MIDESDVIVTVRGPLAGLSEIPDSQFLWENEDHSSSNPNEMQIEEIVTPLGENHVGSQVDRILLNIRFDVLVPKGSGSTEARRVATKIKQLYKIGSSIVGEVTAVVEGSEVLASRDRDAARKSYPVSITVRAEALRD